MCILARRDLSRRRGALWSRELFLGSGPGEAPDKDSAVGPGPAAMGNTCVGPSITKNGFFQSVSTVLWKAPQVGDMLPAAASGRYGCSQGRAPSQELSKPASRLRALQVCIFFNPSLPYHPFNFLSLC